MINVQSYHRHYEWSSLKAIYHKEIVFKFPAAKCFELMKMFFFILNTIQQLFYPMRIKALYLKCIENSFNGTGSLKISHSNIKDYLFNI